MLNSARLPALVFALCAAAPTVRAAAPSTEPIDYAARVAPVFQKFCADCHFDGAAEGELPLDRMTAKLDPAGDHFKWLAVWKNLRAQTMPPSDVAQPSDAEREVAVRWIEQVVFQLDPARPDPGRVTVRRLNRTEYYNTVRDLTGVEYNTLDAFPADDTGYGFDVIGDVLNISPLLMEKYVEAAQAIAARAVPNDGKPTARIYTDGEPPADGAGQRRYLRTILDRFAERAFRRPVDDATRDRIYEIAAGSLDGPRGDFDRAARLGVALILSSPRFVFRVETALPSDDDRAAPIDEYALASRLSYFLWSTMPDAELIRLAGEGRLRAELRPQVDRMLDDARSEQFVRNFVGQWLQTRDVETLSVDARRLLGVKSSDEARKIFTSELRRSMRRETEMLFDYLLDENRPLVELLTADYSFLNATLAKFYGIDGVKSKDMQRIDLDADDHRGGLLTQGSFLIVTSNPTRTSPVKRGLFILENLLGTPAPPPPADVPPLEAVADAKKKLSMREALELHRREPLCNSCHARMDPLGLALEEFSALGQWRDKEGNKPIETGGQLITGEKFGNVRELSHVIAEKRTKDFYRCVTEKLLTYALGRGVEYYDAPAVDRIVGALETDGRMRTLVYGIVESAPFQMRRKESSP